MWHKRLIWTFAALFVLFGLPLYFVQDVVWRHIWGGSSTLCLGGFALALAFSAVTTGELRFQFTLIRRADQPRTFWSAVALVAVTGLVVIITGVWRIWLKTP